MVSLREARGNKTQEMLAWLIGTKQSEISHWETGEKMMSAKSAEKLAEHLPGASADELRFLNRAAAAKRSMREGDPHGVMNAVRGALKIAEGKTLTVSGEQHLDELCSAAEKFFETGFASFGNRPKSSPSDFSPEN